MESPVLVLAWTSGAWRGRSQALAEQFGTEPVFMPWAEHRAGPVGLLWRYARSTWTTFRRLRSRPQPAAVVVQTPPVFAPLAAHLFRRRGTALIIDAHSGAFNDPRWLWSHGLFKWVLRRCELLMVTNLEIIPDDWLPAGVEVAVAHDPLRSTPRPSSPRSRVAVFPASGEADEPLDAVREAGELLSGEGIEIVVTGGALKDSSPGVVVPGWLDQPEYEALLNSSGCVLALTTREGTMQRSAYEALERRIPVVCTSTAVLRESFGSAAVYVQPTGESIAAGVKEALRRGDELAAEGEQVLSRMQAEVQTVVDQILTLPR